MSHYSEVGSKSGGHKDAPPTNRIDHKGPAKTLWESGLEGRQWLNLINVSSRINFRAKLDLYGVDQAQIFASQTPKLVDFMVHFCIKTLKLFKTLGRLEDAGSSLSKRLRILELTLLGFAAV